MMNLFWKGRFLVEIYFVVLTLSLSFVFGLSSIPFDVKPEELATLVGKAFSFKLPIEMTEHIGYTLKFKTPVSDELPSWLSFDEKRNFLLGVPSIHEKGSHIVRLDIIEDATNRTVDTVNYMTIEVVEFEEDINHFKLIRSNDIAEPDKNISKTNLDCPNHSHIIVATLVFDLSSRDLSGAQRTALLLDVSKWLDNDIDELRWMPGKGEKTAFNLKDAVLLTAGPGTEKDPKKRGVSVSWKIGCGDSITESEKSFSSVNRLKSSSQNGAFAVELQSPVVAWHVTYGRVHHRHVVRVRRQVRAQTPVPTSTFIAPTSAIVTQIIETPTMTKSPSRSSVAPTSVRIIPTQTRSPVIPTAIPTFIPTSIKSTSRPSLNKPIDVLTAVVGEPFYFNIPADTFSDLEDGQLPNLLLSIYDPAGNPLPDDLWVKLLPKTNDLVGTPTVPGTTKIALIVTDSDNQKSDLYDVIIQVLPRNNPPHLYNPIDVIPLYIGQPIAYKVPNDTFHDKEDGATENLSLTMTTREGELIDKFPWVEFNMKSQIIYALPMGEIIGKHEFLLIAHDRNGSRAFEAFEFHVYPLPIKPNHYFYLQLDADKKQYDDWVSKRVETLAKVGKYFHKKMNYPSTYSDIRLQKDENKENEETDFLIKWFFADIAKNILAVREYKSKYEVEGNDKQPYTEFKNFYADECPIEGQCNVVKAWVEINDPLSTDDPDVLGRVDDDDDGIWWEYTIIPAFIVAALIFIIGLIIIICIRCRRISKVNKNEKIIFVKPKKPAIFREEYPMKEMYGEQPLVTPNDKPPLPPPAYPRSSTPTDDPSERLLGDNLHIYQAPFESSSEATGGSRPPNSSYRLPPPYVSP